MLKIGGHARNIFLGLAEGVGSVGDLHRQLAGAHGVIGGICRRVALQLGILATQGLELREKIATQDKARREQEQAIANARADAAHAQSIIEQATEVHDHPEITESLAGSLARDKAEYTETEREVAQLEAAEDDVRKRTRDSRVKFTGAIACIVAVILVIVLIWLFASK